jgi:hypothetical protein
MRPRHGTHLLLTRFKYIAISSDTVFIINSTEDVRLNLNSHLVEGIQEVNKGQRRALVKQVQIAGKTSLALSVGNVQVISGGWTCRFSA